MPQRQQILRGDPVENPSPTIFFYADGEGPVTFPRASLSLSSFMETKFSDCESADFLDADIETVECIAKYMEHQRYVCPAGLTPLSLVPVCVESFKAALNVAAFADFLELPDLALKAEIYIKKAGDALSCTLALRTMIDSDCAMKFSDLMSRIDKATQEITNNPPPNRYGPLLDAIGVPQTLGELYLKAVLFTMAQGERKQRALEDIIECIGNIMPPSAQRNMIAQHLGIEDLRGEYEVYELVDLDEVHNDDDEASVVENRRARRDEHRRTRPQKLKRGKQARASQRQGKKNGRRG
ncbi:hypothetical protein BKA59DRAFT_513029 [Fusarium tricinctum]|uniref:BTB domain-containing protein n=1 Tax=Fusarium tricinctum TaxID=61284 RepID=A0A8K0RVS8_9HYPO|nr:hypothetical protein BKA59DRAFT_513029 [Fusarium tricinctum]